MRSTVYMQSEESGRTCVPLRSGMLDLGRCRLVRDGQVIRLTEAETAVLKMLIEAWPQSVSRRSLLVDALDYNPNVASRALDMVVCRLRGKVEQDPSHPRHICTVRGEGYRFEPKPADGPLGRAEAIARIQELQLSYDEVAIAGPPGSGRRTLADCLDGRADFQPGSVYACRRQRTEAVVVLGGVGPAIALRLLRGEEATPHDDVLAELADRAERLPGLLTQMAGMLPWVSPQTMLTAFDEADHDDHKLGMVAPLVEHVAEDCSALSQGELSLLEHVASCPFGAWSGWLMSWPDARNLVNELRARHLLRVDSERLHVPFAVRHHLRARMDATRRRALERWHGSVFVEELSPVLDGAMVWRGRGVCQGLQEERAQLVLVERRLRSHAPELAGRVAAALLLLERLDFSLEELASRAAPYHAALIPEHADTARCVAEFANYASVGFRHWVETLESDSPVGQLLAVRAKFRWKPQEVLEELTQLQRRWTMPAQARWLAEALLLRARAEVRLGRCEQAILNSLAAARVGAGDPMLVAMAHLAHAHAEQHRGDAAAAVRILARAVEQADEGGAVHAFILLRLERAAILLGMGQPEEIVACAEPALEWYRRSGLLGRLSAVHNNQAAGYVALGDLPTASKMYERSWRAARQAGQPRVEAIVRGNQAVLALLLNAPEEAATLLDDALAIEASGAPETHTRVLRLVRAITHVELGELHDGQVLIDSLGSIEDDPLNASLHAVAMAFMAHANGRSVILPTPDGFDARQLLGLLRRRMSQQQSE